MTAFDPSGLGTAALWAATFLFALGSGLVPFVFNLLLFGWSLGMISTALIVRWGPAAETLAWAVPFFIQPFAAVYYPIDALPGAIRWIVGGTMKEGGIAPLEGYFDRVAKAYFWHRFYSHQPDLNYDNPAVQKTFVQHMDGNVREASLILEGMVCAACVWLNEQHLAKLPGILAVSVNYATHRARVRWDDKLGLTGAYPAR